MNRSLTEEEGEGRAHRRSRIPHNLPMSNERASTSPENSARPLLQTAGQRGKSASLRLESGPTVSARGAAQPKSTVTADGSGLSTPKLLDLDLCALRFEGGLDLLGLALGHAFLDRLGCAVDEILGLLEAEAGQLTNDLDDRDLVRTDLREDRGELGLLFDLNGSRNGGGRGGHGGHGGSRGDAELVLKRDLEVGELKDGHGGECLEDLGLSQLCHLLSLLVSRAVTPGRAISVEAPLRQRLSPSGSA